MGNKQSDAAEVKEFNIVKNIPVVSQVYRLPRYFVYLGKGNIEQVRRSGQYKVQNLNPLKCIGGIARGIAALTVDLQKGIWIGKRPLSYSFVSLTLLPGYHWAVMVNRVIYHVKGKTDSQDCIYQITMSQKQKQTFHWYATDFKTTMQSTQIKSIFQQREAKKMKYAILAASDESYQNCQTFALHLISCICNTTIEDIRAQFYLQQMEHSYFDQKSILNHFMKQINQEYLLFKIYTESLSYYQQII